MLRAGTELELPEEGEAGKERSMVVCDFKTAVKYGGRERGSVGFVFLCIRNGINECFPPGTFFTMYILFYILHS